MCWIYVTRVQGETVTSSTYPPTQCIYSSITSEQGTKLPLHAIDTCISHKFKLEAAGTSIHQHANGRAPSLNTKAKCWSAWHWGQTSSFGTILLISKWLLQSKEFENCYLKLWIDTYGILDRGGYLQYWIWLLQFPFPHLFNPFISFICNMPNTFSSFKSAIIIVFPGGGGGGGNGAPTKPDAIRKTAAAVWGAKLDFTFKCNS